MGGAVMTWKPSVARLLAATPWLRAYQVAGAPLLLALAVALPVVISVVASRLMGASAPASYAMSAGGLAVLLVLSSGLNLHGMWDGLDHVPAQ